MCRLETIDDETAARLYDRLYFTVRTKLIDKKGHDNFAKDQQAREITDELIRKLDGFEIWPPREQRFDHSNIGHGLSAEEMDVAVRAARCWKPVGKMPIMNSRPAKKEEPNV